MKDKIVKLLFNVTGLVLCILYYAVGFTFLMILASCMARGDGVWGW